MSSIYQDYRPNNFTEILGQNHIKVTLQNEIMTNNISHAYLFCGPRAVGKTTTARILAKAVNCSLRKDEEFEPCNKCDNCLSIKKGNNFDVLEIDAASNTGVENVRDNIISFSRLAPSSGKYKVFIIDEVHMLSTQAFNALLKTMEEPPSYVIFILCTTEIHKVPGTIISRCERFDFKKISSAEVVRKLSDIVVKEKIEVDKDVLLSIAKSSGGYMRDAESLLGQVLAIGGKVIKKEQAELILPSSNDKEAIDLLNSLLKKDTAKAFSIINTLADRGVNLKSFNNDLISVLRHLMIEKFSPGTASELGLDLGEDLDREMSKLNPLISQEEVVVFLKRFMSSLSSFSDQNISQLPLEIAVAELCLNSKNLASSNSDIKNSINSVNKTNTTNRVANVGQSAPLKTNTNPNPNTTNANVSTNSLNNTSNTINTNNTLKQATNSKTSSSESTETKAKSEIKTEEKSANSGSSLELKNLSQEEVFAKWPEFLVKIKNKNHSLSFVLQSCRPREIKDSSLCLSFKYKFHQTRINEADIRAMVLSVLHEVYGENLDFNTIIDEDLSINNNTSEDNDSNLSNKEEEKQSQDTKTQDDASLGSVLNVFGGQIIN